MFLAEISDLYDFSFLLNESVIKDFLSGIATTLEIALLGVLIGICFGLILAIGKLLGNKFIRAICTTYITLIRSTPLILQLYMIHYVTPFVYLALNDTSLIMSAFISSVIAVGLNSAAYVAEIFRSGILAVDKGQFEAAQSLGFNYTKTLRLIIVPQATKNIFPALVNELTSVTKETAIISVVGAHDLMFYGNQMRAITMNPFTGLFVAGICYFVVVYTLTKLTNVLERKLQND